MITSGNNLASMIAQYRASQPQGQPAHVVNPQPHTPAPATPGLNQSPRAELIRRMFAGRLGGQQQPSGLVGMIRPNWL